MPFQECQSQIEFQQDTRTKVERLSAEVCSAQALLEDLSALTQRCEAERREFERQAKENAASLDERVQALREDSARHAQALSKHDERCKADSKDALHRTQEAQQLVGQLLRISGR